MRLWEPQKGFSVRDCEFTGCMSRWDGAIHLSAPSRLEMAPFTKRPAPPAPRGMFCEKRIKLCYLLRMQTSTGSLLTPASDKRPRTKTKKWKRMEAVNRHLLPGWLGLLWGTWWCLLWSLQRLSGFLRGRLGQYTSAGLA